MEPAKDVKNVLPFLVNKLFKLKENAVNNDIDDFPKFLCLGISCCDSSGSYGLVSP